MSYQPPAKIQPTDSMKTMVDKINSIRESLGSTVVSTTEPTENLENGLVWYNPETNITVMYLDGSFRDTGMTIVKQPTEPTTNLKEGLFWLNTLTNKIKMYTSGSFKGLGSFGTAAKAVEEVHTADKTGVVTLKTKYRYNQSMKMIITGLTFPVPDSAIVDNGMTLVLSAISPDLLSTGDTFSLSWLDETPLGKDVKHVQTILGDDGVVAFDGFSYERGMNYCSVYVDGFRAFEGTSDFSFTEVDDQTIKINGDYSGSSVFVEVLVG